MRVLKPGLTFLEIGPGNMLLAQELLRYFTNGTLIEYSEDAIEVYNTLPEKTQSRLDLMLVDFFEYELTNQFDCVVACEVMEHIPEDEAFLRKLWLALQNGGQLILSVPALMKFWSPHDDIVGHVRRYEKEPLSDLLHRVGFIDVQIHAYGFPFVNWLRFPRIWLAQKQYTQTILLSSAEQTKKSGIAQTAHFSSLFGIFVKPFTVYPFAQISSLFESADRSGAYLISAFKPLNTP